MMKLTSHVYLWWIHVDIWQNQYNILKLKKKIKDMSQLELSPDVKNSIGS